MREDRDESGREVRREMKGGGMRAENKESRREKRDRDERK